jgi:hypothetical protein
VKMASTRRHVTVTPSTWPSERLRVSRGSRDSVVRAQVTSQPWFTCEQCNSELQGEGKKVRLMLCVHCAKRCHDGHRGIKYLRTSKVACMCFECCDCILMKEVEQKAREEGIVPLNKLARYEAEEVKRRVRSRRPVVRHRGDSFRV